MVMAQDLAVDLTDNTVQRGSIRLRVPPLQAVMLHVLNEEFPSIVPHAEMHKALYGGAKTVDLKPIRVMVTHLRKLLPPLQIDIHTVHGVGYLMTKRPVVTLGVAA
jgi:DNA-binding response OmpR family regulator